MAEIAPGIYRDRADWGEAVLCGLFLLVFPPAIFFMWLEPRDRIPLYFVIPFTVLFCFAVPYLLAKLRAARSRTIAFDESGRRLTVRETTPFGRSDWIADIADIDSLAFKTIDNDGFWHKAMIRLKDGRDVVFAQGAYEPGVREVYDSLLGKLRGLDPSLRTDEIRARH